MEQVYNQMYHKSIAHWNNPNKGDNSGRDEITRNNGELRDGVCLKTLHGFK